MAVQARHRNLFPTQILSNREFATNGGVEGNGNVFGVPIGYGVVAPLSGTTTATEIAVPMYGTATTGGFPVKTAVKSESGLTYVPVPRKRSREEASDSMVSSFPSAVQNQIATNRCGSFTFLGEDISFQIQQQQLEIDRFIAQHTDKVRMEIEDRRKKYSRRIAAAVEENILKKLKAKEEDLEKLGKLNCALEEKVKSLCVENQIWRDMAQTNEANANALRCNLEQVLAQIQDDHNHHQRRRTDAAELADDAQSSCGSNFEETDRRRFAEITSTDAAFQRNYSTSINAGCIAPTNMNRMCRSCDREESCVLLLPCRHLCLCTSCGSALHTCPVCHSTKTASVHVNLSP
ncbi:probable BOI-related E3 ubiquitin-protein ligase 2 [Andrographis paniculata]|uniref:probable BOI-related E3 ubiquitin-protein ligase 2 n=1 Tax=Andrographis paniculata TaxID=175694 RepID=UPI0021E8FBB6|nr:probable BOI-related E3 ubiquitin-protein ligase 2 [Andrographis paniculata]